MQKENDNNINKTNGCVKEIESGNRIILDGPDVFYIAQQLGVSIEDVTAECCEWNLGPVSGLPVIYLKNTEEGNCIFWHGGQCSISNFTPISCIADKDDKNPYISIDTKRKCLISTHREDRIEEYVRWNEMATKLAEKVGKLPKESQEIVAPYCMQAMYTGFDESKGFMDSFTKCEILADRIIESVGYALEAAGIDAS